MQTGLLLACNRSTAGFLACSLSFIDSQGLKLDLDLNTAQRDAQRDAEHRGMHVKQSVVMLYAWNHKLLVWHEELYIEQQPGFVALIPDLAWYCYQSLLASQSATTDWCSVRFCMQATIEKLESGTALPADYAKVSLITITFQHSNGARAHNGIARATCDKQDLYSHGVNWQCKAACEAGKGFLVVRFHFLGQKGMVGGQSTATPAYHPLVCLKLASLSIEQPWPDRAMKMLPLRMLTKGGAAIAAKQIVARIANCLLDSWWTSKVKASLWRVPAHVFGNDCHPFQLYQQAFWSDLLLQAYVSSLPGSTQLGLKVMHCSHSMADPLHS